MFQLTQLRCFVAVATELHFGRAATLLHMTQPPLSRQIQLLEHALEVQLLERSGAGVSLTPAGATFLREAQDILRRSEAAVLAARRAMRADAGSVTLGYVAATCYSLLPQVLEVLRRELPEVHVVLREMQTIDQLEALSSDRLDLGIVRPFVPRSFASSSTLLREPLLLATPIAHGLAQAPQVSLRDLQGQPFIEYCSSETRYLYELIAGRLQAEGVAPETVLTLSHTHAILSMVNAGWGIALVPASAAYLGFSNIIYIPLGDENAMHAELHLVWRKNTRNKVAEAVLFVLQNAASSRIFQSEVPHPK